MGRYKDAEKSYEDALRMIQSGSWAGLKNRKKVIITTYLNLALTKYNLGNTGAALEILNNRLADTEIARLDDENLGARVSDEEIDAKLDDKVLDA